MSDDDTAIDQETGLVNVYRLLPNPGDALMIVNCGTHFEVRHQALTPVSEFHLTDEDVDNIRQGKITWN